MFWHFTKKFLNKTFKTKKNLTWFSCWRIGCGWRRHQSVVFSFKSGWLYGAIRVEQKQHFHFFTDVSDQYENKKEHKIRHKFHVYGNELTTESEWPMCRLCSVLGRRLWKSKQTWVSTDRQTVCLVIDSIVSARDN